MLHYAALTVWSYGYALEGALPPEQLAAAPAGPATPAQAQRDMYEFLLRVGSVATPEALVNLRGRNRCVGLLMVVRDMFSMTRWELLEEAAKLLTNCIDLLLGHPATGPAAEPKMR